MLQIHGIRIQTHSTRRAWVIQMGANSEICLWTPLPYGQRANGGGELGGTLNKSFELSLPLFVRFSIVQSWRQKYFLSNCVSCQCQRLSPILLHHTSSHYNGWNGNTVREAPFLIVLVLYGHCPNSFIPPPLCQTGKLGKKVLQTILASLYTTPPPFGQCPYKNNTFQKGASLIPGPWYHYFHCVVKPLCDKTYLQYLITICV